MKLFTPLLLLAFLAFSCGDNADTTVDDTMADVETTTIVEDNQPDPMIGGTIDAVQSTGGDITALPAGAAVSNIDGWISKLSSMDGTDGIVNELQSLKTELTSGNIDGMKVSGILSSLATSTRSMESKAPGLGTIASALQAGADKLGGM
ncbi:hypothetical protein [Neolewinella antarctica]|uniref:Uncharacterized protein n=1 Tax=Neolewinella antarctica TaxID=442734 RepID=A0ABX0XA50_9BACT|nr:hypothetical protein [Neolewinella antarctica]NJC25698.1 hypothetical protein [Neolewinella antarctica]